MSTEIIHWGSDDFISDNYQMCSKTVMDNISDPNITFDKEGVCSYYHEYQHIKSNHLLTGEARDKKLANTLKKIKSSKGKYDCILGISGGVDSTYLAYRLKQLNVNVLLVHFDNGWNSELAVKNIENIIEKTKFDYETFVMDWEEFKDLQRSYFKASVLDLEVPTDHMIFGALYKIANKKNIKYIISGNNLVTEWLVPKTWNYAKFDLVNLKNIHKKFGKKKLVLLPKLGVWEFAYYQLFKKIEGIPLLNYIDYNKAECKKLIIKELDWIDYGGKHYESIFTRFYQGYILPNKFGIDKRKAHLSNLILSDQLTREEALKELKNPPIDVQLADNDKEYVSKKLGFSDQEFSDVLRLPNLNHESYGTDKKKRQLYFSIMKLIKPLTSIIKKIGR